jgi:DNA-directed RNA polymerase subunit RPC12/RpoP
LGGYANDINLNGETMTGKIKCNNCGSIKIIPKVRVLDQGHYSDGVLSAAIDTKPEAVIFKGWIRTGIRADVCATCGHMDLFVDNPGELYKAYLRKQKEGNK